MNWISNQKKKIKIKHFLFFDEKENRVWKNIFQLFSKSLQQQTVEIINDRQEVFKNRPWFVCLWFESRRRSFVINVHIPAFYLFLSSKVADAPTTTQRRGFLFVLNCQSVEEKSRLLDWEWFNKPGSLVEDRKLLTTDWNIKVLSSWAKRNRKKEEEKRFKDWVNWNKKNKLKT